MTLIAEVALQGAEATTTRELRAATQIFMALKPTVTAK